MTDTEWVPRRIQNIDREIAHEEQRLPGLERDVAECKERINTLRKDRAAEMEHAGRAV